MDSGNDDSKAGYSQASGSSVRDQEAAPCDEMDLEQIFQKLCDKVRSVGSEINEVQKSSVTIPINTPLTHSETTLSPNITHLLEEKLHILSHLVNKLNRTNSVEFSECTAHGIVDVSNTMTDEALSCEKTVNQLIMQVADDEIDSSRCKHNIQLLEEMKQAITDDGLESRFIQMINNEFLECKADMRVILNSLFPGNEGVEHLLQELVERKFAKEDDEKWYNYKDDQNVFQAVYLFERACIIKRHEQNQFLICLII